MKITIGKPIKYTNNVEEMIAIWSNKVKELLEGNKDESEKC